MRRTRLSIIRAGALNCLLLGCILTVAAPAYGQENDPPTPAYSCTWNSGGGNFDASITPTVLYYGDTFAVEIKMCPKASVCEKYGEFRAYFVYGGHRYDVDLTLKDDGYGKTATGLFQTSTLPIPPGQATGFMVTLYAAQLVPHGPGCSTATGFKTKWSKSTEIFLNIANYVDKAIEEGYEGENTDCVWQGDFCECPPYVEYITDPTQRDRFFVRSMDGLGKLYKGGTLFDTDDADDSHFEVPAAIFVMDGQGHIYAAKKHRVCRFHHSSFFAGRPVYAAGELVVKNGVITRVNNCSGHYMPSPKIVEQLYDSLIRQGYDQPLPKIELCQNLLW